MKIKAHHSWVLIKPEPRKEVVGSILLPNEINIERVSEGVGVVVSMPDELWPKSIKTDKPVKPHFKVGDRVLFRGFLKDLNQVEHDGEMCCFLHWEDLLGVVPEGVEAGVLSMSQD